MAGLFERVGGWRTAIIGVRMLTVVAALLGLGQALPVIVVDLSTRYSLPLPDGVLDLLVRGDFVGSWQANPVVLAAAAAAVAGTMYRKPHALDGAALGLLALASGLAILPWTVALAGMRSPAMDGILVCGIACAIVVLVSSRLTPAATGAIFALFASMALVAVQALLADALHDREPEGAAVVAAATLTLVAFIAYRFLPWATWHARLEGHSVRVATLVLMPCILAGGPLLAAHAGETTAALLLVGLLAAVLLTYGGILLTLHIRAPLHVGGQVDVDRPPARVFRELTDVHTPLAAGSPERRLEALDDRPVGPGSRLRYRSTDGQAETVIVAVLEAPGAFEWELASTAYGARTSFAVEARQGGSRVNWRQRLDVPLYWWMRPSYRRSVKGYRDEAGERLRAGHCFVDDVSAAPDPASA